METIKKFKPNYVHITHPESDSDDDVLDVENSSGEHYSAECVESTHSTDTSFQDKVDDSANITSEDSISSFKAKCLNELKYSDLLDEVIDILYEHGQLHDFMSLLRNLKTGDFPHDNIVFLLLLERVRFQNCRNTVAMRYGERTKLFWTIVYRLCKGSGLKFFSGAKSWGQVVTKESDKSVYDPQLAKINFAVPDEKVLRDYRNSLPKVLPPGKIYQSLELLRDKSNIVLMGDGKLVTKGLKTDFSGDVNLFGHESNPNLDALKDEFHNLLEFISNCCTTLEDKESGDKFNTLEDLLEINTQLIQKIRTYHTCQRKKLTNLTGRGANAPEKAISACKTNMYTSAIWIKKALKLNLQLMQMLATLQTNLHLFQTSTEVDLHELQNLRILFNSNYVSSNVNHLDYPHLIKKYSELWYDLVRESVVTSDSAYNSVGLNGVKLMKEHFGKFVKEEVPVGQRDKTEYCANELNGMATLCCTFMSSLLPSCAVFYEEGCSFIDGKKRLNMLCSTSAGMIR